MSRRTHYRRRSKEALELDMTTFLNLMVVLVPFLLITAVFSRITIIELSLPTSEGAAAPVGEELLPLGFQVVRTVCGMALDPIRHPELEAGSGEASS